MDSTSVTSTPAGGGIIWAPAMTNPIFTALRAMMASTFLIFEFTTFLTGFVSQELPPSVTSKSLRQVHYLNRVLSSSLIFLYSRSDMRVRCL